jgi:hypothetical protein
MSTHALGVHASGLKRSEAHVRSAVRHVVFAVHGMLSLACMLCVG